MGIYRKNLRIQTILFVSFIILGINVALNYFLSDVAPWYSFIILGVAIGFIVWVIMIYKSEDAMVIEIDPKDYQAIRVSLYGYFFIYVIQIIMQSFESINQMILAIVAATLLTLIAVFGLLIHLKLLSKA